MGWLDALQVLKPGMDADEATLLKWLTYLRDRKQRATEAQQREIEEAENEVREALNLKE